MVEKIVWEISPKFPYTIVHGLNIGYSAELSTVVLR
jgi:hypothetical protein